MVEVCLEDIQQLCKADALHWTDHVAKRLIARRITPDEVIACLLHGKIIEQYPTDYPFPSCLVFGMTSLSRPLHVVCSISNNICNIITAYQPDPAQWDKTFQYRAKGE